jgi:uncharacterized cupin superfamily protein
MRPPLTIPPWRSTVHAMIVPKGTAPADEGSAETADKGPRRQEHVSDVGGLTQLGAHVETLMPGSVSSDRHWHEDEDELLFMLDGEAVLVEDAGEETLRPGDAAVWAKGTPNAHQIANRSSRSCTYLIVGARVAAGAIHYPELGRTCHFEGKRWRVVDRDGNVLREGEEP